MLLISSQVIVNFYHHELIVNRNSPSVSAFYAERQFNRIAEYIGKKKSQYRIASIGMHPSIAMFNGFYTLDGYFSNYPLKYKKSFRKIIEGELDKDQFLKNSYDNWGSRVYVFSSELKKNNTQFKNFAGNNNVIERLDIDQKAFHNLGGQYLFSAVRIDETKNKNIKLEKIFKDELSAWDVYLYKVEP